MFNFFRLLKGGLFGIPDKAVPLANYPLTLNDLACEGWSVNDGTPMEVAHV